MPITQSRFLSVISAAARLIDTIRQIKRLTQGADSLTSNANSVIARTEDANAREVVKAMVGIINNLRSVIANNDDNYSDLMATVLAEEKYFKRVRKSNDASAFYQKRKREIGRDNSVYESDVSKNVSNNTAIRPLPPPVLTKNMQDYLDGKVDTLEDDDDKIEPKVEPNKVEPAKIEPNKVVTKTKSKSAKEAEEAKETKPTEEAKSTKSTPPPALSGAAYKDPNVLSTSTPSLEELNAIPIAPNKDVF